MTTTRLFAQQGWSLQIPTTWDVLVNRGEWETGYVVFIEGNQPRVNCSWQRRKHTISMDRTLKSLDRTIRRQHAEHAPSLDHRTPLPEGEGELFTWTSKAGEFHVAVVIHPHTKVTHIIRQLAPGSQIEVLDLAATSRSTADDAPTRWCLYGLDFELPTAWRLEGINNTVGLVRGVWMRYPDLGKTRVDQVLVLRRFAGAEVVLDGAPLHTWLQERLEPRDELVASGSDEGVVWFQLRTPARSLWQRIRKKRQDKYLWAWVDPASERLMVQEWTGHQDPLPCLRSGGMPHDPPAKTEDRSNHQEGS